MIPEIATAAPQMLPDATTTRQSAGWKLTLSIKRMSIDPVPSLGANPLGREGLISATASLQVEPAAGQDTTGRPEIDVRQLTLSAEVSCQTDVSDGYQFSLNPTIAASPINPLLPSAPDNLNLAIDPTLSLNQGNQVTAKPGKAGGAGVLTADGRQQIASRILQGEKARDLTLALQVATQDLLVESKPCAGPVYARIRADSVLQTAVSAVSLAASGAPVQL